MKPLKLLYAVLAAGQVCRGAVHAGATARLFDHLLSTRALWFACGGLVIMMTGSLNLLRQRYGPAAPGLVRVTLAANLVLTAFGITYGSVSRASAAAWALVLGLNLGTTILCLVPGAQRGDEQRLGAAA